MPRIFALLMTTAVLAVPSSAQSIEDPMRLSDVARVQIRGEAVWDQMITESVGGGTQEQFRGALEQTLEGVITEADDAPSVVQGATATVACHVDTYYEAGLIMYALRVQLERQGSDGQPIVTWIKSWVGSYTVQQLHRMFTLGEQCAQSFLDDWRSVN
jgi:hypothetical protein